MAKSADAFRTISEVAEWLDVPAHVLRFWESKFTQIKPVKRAGGRRYYRPSDMALIGGIKVLLHDDGMTIKGVQKILREQGIRHVSSLSPEIADEDRPAARAPADEGDAPMMRDAPEERGRVLRFQAPGAASQPGAEAQTTPDETPPTNPAAEQDPAQSEAPMETRQEALPETREDPASAVETHDARVAGNADSAARETPVAAHSEDRAEDPGDATGHDDPVPPEEDFAADPPAFLQRGFPTPPLTDNAPRATESPAAPPAREASPASGPAESPQAPTTPIDSAPADGPEPAPSHPEVSAEPPAATPRSPLGAEVPPDPAPEAVAARPGPLSQLARIRRIDPELAARIAPLTARLQRIAGNDAARQ